jgi:hypothetical protein
LQEVLPRDLAGCPGAELLPVDDLADRLSWIEQAAVKGDSSDQADHRLGGAEQHLRRVRVSPAADLLSPVQHHATGAIAGQQRTAHLAV